MRTKESIKNEIDQLPDHLLEPLDRYLQTLIRIPRDRKPLSGYKLGGHFDKVSIREQAYE